MLFYVVLNGFEYFMNLNNTNMLNICFQNLQKMIFFYNLFSQIQKFQPKNKEKLQKDAT